MNLLAKQKTRHRCREQIYGYQEGKGKWSGLGDWDWHIYSIIYKVEMRTDCIAQETLLNTLMTSMRTGSKEEWIYVHI